MYAKTPRKFDKEGILQKCILGGTQLPRPLYSGLGNACTLQKQSFALCFLGIDLGLAWRRFSHTSCVSWLRCKKQLPEADQELSGGAQEVLGAANSCPVAVRSCRELSGSCQELPRSCPGANSEDVLAA